MKKLLILTGIICMLFGISAHAANGDIAGHIYSTDIRAFINGVEVPSYNIGGRTVVVVEDVTSSHEYYDDYRTLKMWSLSPYDLSGGQAENYSSKGRVVGNVYETDIVTSIYDVALPSYNIGGKTAVVIEDLGSDGEFNEIGGKYIWNAEERTISLEFMYWSEPGDIMISNNINIEYKVNRDFTRVDAVFTGNAFYSGGGHYEYENENYTNDNKPRICPIYTVINGEERLIGYNFGHHRTGFLMTDDEHFEPDEDYYSFNYFYEDAFREAAEATVTPIPTREDIINEYIDSLMGTIHDRIDTDSYSFLYLTQGTPHGSHAMLPYIRSDGSYHDLSTDFKSVSFWGTISFDKVEIDKENEKVYIHYDEDYIFDLKTCQLTYANGDVYSQYPALPETDRAHYVIYKEGYRDYRVELAVFDTDADKIEWKNNGINEENPLYPNGTYENDIKYYLDGDKWVEFERGYERISNNAVNVMESSLDVINTNKHYITCFGKRRNGRNFA